MWMIFTQEVSSVERMVGSRNSDGSREEGTLSKILSLGGFSDKEFVVEKEINQKESNLLSNSVFGYSWDSKLGLLSLRFKLSLTKKTRSRKIQPIIRKEDLETLSSVVLTK